MEREIWWAIALNSNIWNFHEAAFSGSFFVFGSNSNGIALSKEGEKLSGIKKFSVDGYSKRRCSNEM
jgi:hypothetical protein